VDIRANRGAEPQLGRAPARFRNEEWPEKTRARRREGFFRSLLDLE